ncbi:MAG: 3-isopropylmalate dehydrogenase [Actinobacteria bacterium]|nr:3-isopropylmalate dehydrogenase [Actinomycetota bacterium]
MTGDLWNQFQRSPGFPSPISRTQIRFAGVSDRRSIVVFAGDGVGPEIMAPALRILRYIGDFDIDERLIGAASIREHGTALTDDCFEAAQRSDGILLAAVGDPEFSGTEHEREGLGLLRLRKDLDLYANLRPVHPIGALSDASVLRPEVLEGSRVLVVRELTGGAYFGARGRSMDGSAFDTTNYAPAEIERVARTAFGLARRRVTSVDKANVLETSRLWRETVERLHSAEFSHIPLDHLYVDNAALQLIASPGRFDVVLAENMFGDILSDLTGVLAGSIGLLPSASVGAAGSPGLFEPVHGSAPDIAGVDIANPAGMILTTAMMLRIGLDLPEEALTIEEAVEATFEAGVRTPDLGGSVGTAAFGDEVLRRLRI